MPVVGIGAPTLLAFTQSSTSMMANNKLALDGWNSITYLATHYQVGWRYVYITKGSLKILK